MEETGEQTSYFKIGDQSRDQSLQRANPDSDVIVRGLCAVYFENHVSPLLRSLQQTQESLNAQLADIRTQLSTKADMKDVPTADAVDDLVTKVDLGNTLLAQQLQDVTAVIEQKVGVEQTHSLQKEVAFLRSEIG